MQNFFTRKNLIIAVVVVILAGGGIIWYFTRPEAEVPEGEERQGFFSRLFPGGGERELTEAERKRLEEAQQGGAGLETAKPRSFKLVEANVAGAVFVKNPSTSSGQGKVRYIDRETGHVFEMNPDGTDKTRISNTTIPGIFEVIWSPDGTRAILKYAAGDKLNILSARFIASSTQGVFLPSDLKDIVFSPRGERVAYVLPDGEEALVIAASPDNKNQRALARNPFASWRISWPEEGNIFLWPAPSGFNDGFLYRLNLAAGTLTKLLGPRLGLDIKTDGKNLVFAESDPGNKTLASSFLDVGSLKMAPVNLKIIPSKCAWSRLNKNTAFCAVPVPLAPAVYPDDWLEGKISFFDVLVKINSASLTAASFELDHPPAGGPDATGLFLDADEKNIFYINRRDGSLWKVEMEGS